MAGYLKYNWSYETLPVKAMRHARKQFETRSPAHYGLKEKARVYFYNALSELDQPGEWYFDKKGRYLIVLLPRQQADAGQSHNRQAKRGKSSTWDKRSPTSPLMISIAPHLLELHQTQNIKFRHIAFEQARGTAIEVHGGQNTVFDECLIRNTGGAAIAFTGGRHNGIRRSTIYDTGAGGVLLEGGNRKTLTPAGLYALNNHITRYARLSRTYRPAISLRGVGNRAAGNYIANAPHMAIFLAGNDHLIERNEITRTVLETGDAGAIYTGRDWTARGTLLRHNFLHDIRGQNSLPNGKKLESKGIYLDDMTSGIKVEGNVFLDVQQPVFIGGGRDNEVRSNIFVRSPPGVYMDGRGKTWDSRSIDNPESELRQALTQMPYTSPLWQQAYPGLANILEDDPASPKNNVLDNNLFLQQDIYLLEPEVEIGLQKIGANYDARQVTVRGSPYIGTFVKQMEKAEDFLSIEHKRFTRRLSSPIPFGVMDRKNRAGWRYAQTRSRLATSQN